MDESVGVTWDGTAGTAGGSGFAAAVQALAVERGLDAASLSAAIHMPPAWVDEVFAAKQRVALPLLARFAQAFKLRAIEFLQRANLLSLEVYVLGLDPLYFLPPGQIRHDARIYMREINPRHAVPERDMLVRNPTLKALLADEVLDATGKLEVELTYLLRAAVQNTGGTL
ncbi:MAG: hypothetical protein ACLPYS_10985 [Vulcanimicrobiaceae bacterium]